MKSAYLKNLAFAAFVCGTSAYGQQSGTIANVTLKLIEQYSEDALFQKDEFGNILLDKDNQKIPTDYNEYSVDTYSGDTITKSTYTYEEGSKIATYKISNKEFLEALVEEGVIQNIFGWALVTVDADDVGSGTFITKKDAEPINVDQYLYTEWGDVEAEAEQESTKEVYTYNWLSDTETFKATGTQKSRSLVGIKSQFASAKIDSHGVLDETATLKTFGTGEDQYTQWIDGANNITSISGSLVYFDDYLGGWDNYDGSLITGSISIAAEKLADLSLFSFPVP